MECAQVPPAGRANSTCQGDVTFYECYSYMWAAPAPLCLDARRFTGLADYQYVSAGRNSSLGAEERMGPFGEEAEPMLLVPPSFARHDHPLDYAFRNSRTTDGRPGDSLQGAEGQYTESGTLRTCVVCTDPQPSAASCLLAALQCIDLRVQCVPTR